MQPRSGGEILVASLVRQGATHLFGVPGESYLPVLDALVDVRDRLAFVVCRQEGGAAYMAEAAGKLTGRARAPPRSASTSRARTRRRWCSSWVRSAPT
jgi:acetolactate synthase-1/2/3 large subunit